ncbi:hypothetical protein CCAX7_38090 [Capsulimonas corticalis]|uniref:Uncharacterized protein n=1 Tax=Capsulimonas corticalis TaxID=2219043 RepID=A0A402D0U9_9BACT|nr:hypothetical protein [Capsulimonas corticalis]BDI31758.1 hypothetical protein CCAX7_38090 [Capsulimonas corticalis]
MTLCYYVTGHGFGHAIRTAQILKALPRDVDVIVRTTAAPSVFREELPGRSLRFLPAEFDCGSLQSDSVTTLARQTLDHYAEIEKRNNASLADEVAFLKREGVRCVVSDIPSFPLRAAFEAGVPGVAITNFTWHDIYQEYVETDADQALLDRMGDEYRTATVGLITPLATPTVENVFTNIEHVPIVARRGLDVGSDLRKALRCETPHLALLYFGVWGLDLDWPALAAFRDWTFLTFDTPSQSVANVKTLSTDQWRYADIAASVDLVITKPGYGTVTECIANSVPLMYIPRQGFVEAAALERGMAPWGGGIRIESEAFLNGNWGEALAAALSARLNSEVYRTDGAAVVAERLLGLLA